MISVMEIFNMICNFCFSVSTNQRASAKNSALAMGWSPNPCSCPSTPRRTPWCPVPSAYEGPPRERVLCEARGTVLLALHLDHRATGVGVRQCETDITVKGCTDFSLTHICPSSARDLSLCDVPELSEENWHGRPAQSGLRLWGRRGFWEQWEAEGQRPSIRHSRGEVLQIWHQAWVDDSPQDNQSQVCVFLLHTVYTNTFYCQNIAFYVQYLTVLSTSLTFM